MRRFIVAGAVLLLSASVQASSLIASTDVVLGGLTRALGASSNATTSLVDNKIVQAARDDAAQFLATDGDMRGVRLEAAFQFIREQAPSLEATDTQLAEAILAQR